MTRKPVSVLGAGAWGTALACALADRHDVLLWARDAGQVRRLSSDRRNERYLPGVVLPAALGVCGDLAQAAAAGELLIAATPVAGLRELLRALRALRALGSKVPVIWLCKGFEQGSGLLPHEIFAAEAGSAIDHGVLSGPSFALEVARGLPCALTLAARDERFARDTAAVLHGGRMRVYHSGDLVGVELGGAVKNVLAIAVGISDGLGLGQSARAALITRGLAEMTRLGVALGGTAQTFMGLAGAGDLILTATGDLSRNRRVGLELARGRALPEILAGLGHVAEGVSSAAAIVRLGERQGVELPVTRAVSSVLAGAMQPREAVEWLLAREPKVEG